ncbi:MAG: glycosyltransferase family 1 protein [Chitinophagaceae bacterium]|nr:MAG: glycosyltransferase family 1 protein [Chitinophagaceae bacterium]
MSDRKKIIRITTVPISLKVLLRRQLNFMSRHFDVLGVSSPGPILSEVAEQEGVRIAAVEMTRSITPVKDLRAVWQLYRLFKKERPQIVHTHTPKAGLLGMLAARIAGVPVRLHTVAGLPLMEATGKKRIVLEQVEKLTYAAATMVYPNSSNLAAFILQSRFCAPSKVKVLGNGSSNGIDTAFFSRTSLLEQTAAQLQSTLALKPENFVYVFIGRLVRDKGIEELVTAFTKLHRQHPHIRLLLVGPFEPELDPLGEDTLRELKENKAIITVGFQSDVRPYYLLSDVLAFPSYREGFPNVPMQAGCFDLPSIVTDINGCNEIVSEGTNGLIIPPKSADHLYKAMDRLLRDQQLYLQMKNVARKMIVERYDQQYLWNLILKEYQKHLNYVP